MQHMNTPFALYTHRHAPAMRKAGVDEHEVTVHVLGRTFHVTEHSLGLALHQAIMITGVLFIWYQIVGQELVATTASQTTLVMFCSYTTLVFLNACLSVHEAM